MKTKKNTRKQCSEFLDCNMSGLFFFALCFTDPLSAPVSRLPPAPFCTDVLHVAVHVYDAHQINYFVNCSFVLLPPEAALHSLFQSERE